jgi:predicted metal-dependent phosphoesterase TrpH
MRIDLHTHSTASDGTEPPAEVVRRGRAAGLDVLALTDHDGVDGLPAARAALPERLTLVPGMELSCRRDEMSVHMLAYLFDASEPELAAECARIRRAREQRGRKMVQRLIELGAPVTWEQVTALAGDGAVGRPHIARAMVAAGAIEDPAQAFTTEWIAPGGRAYVSRYALDPAAAVRLVRAAGGAPCTSRRSERVNGGAEADR